MSTKGRSLELYYIDGTPDGMVTATVPFQWTGHVLVASRNQIAEALKRDEASRTGVYMLLGDADGGQKAYIGEGEDISDRIRSHDVKKDWWTKAVLITDTGNELNKAHVKYLEARLVEAARDVGKLVLENGNMPARSSLSEAHANLMEGFLDNIFTVLPALRIDCFLSERRPMVIEKKEQPATAHLQQAQEAPRFVLRTKKHGVAAEAILSKGEFIVLKGAKARKEWSPGSRDHNYRHLHDALITEGVLAPEGDHFVFTENYAFASPSAAGAMINGRATNGRQEWKHASTGQSYHDWELSNLDVEGKGQ